MSACFLQMPVAVANDAYCEVRSTPEWDQLRRQIYKLAMHFNDELVFDFREMLSVAANAEMAGRMLWQLIKPFQPEVLIGPGFGATPLLFATALAALRNGVELNILMVRDKRKEHNRKKWVEGRRCQPNSRAVIVDDFMKDGSAVPLVEEALRADSHQLDVRAVAIFFDMWQPLGSRQISTSKYPVVSLYTRHDIGLSRDCFDARPPTMKGAYPEFLLERLWWRFDLNTRRDYPYKSTPIVADEAVFVADDQCRVWRHNAQNGDIEWRYDSLDNPRKGIVQMLQYAEGSLIFGCYDGTVTRLDARTGAIIWRWRQDSSIHATPTLALQGMRLFINTEQWNEGKPFGHLYALDWSSGRVLWRYPHKYWPPGSPAYDAPSNTVIASCNDQSVVCVDADSGAVRWQAKSDGLVRGRPAITNGKVYLATEKGRLHSFDLDSGEPAWTTRYGKGEGHQFLKVRGDCVFAYDGRWHLTAFDAGNGEIRWISRLRSPGTWCPVDHGRYMVALSRQGHIAVLDPAKELKVWEGQIGGHYRQPPAVGAGLLAAASNDQGLQVFRINPFYEN